MRIGFGEIIDFLLREVDGGFEIDPEIQDGPVDLENAFRELAGQRPHRRAGGALRSAVDQVGYRLGLGKIDLVVEEGPFGEFARPGDPGAQGAGALEQPGHDDGSAMALQFDHVLACERLRRRKEKHDAAVDRAPVGVDEVYEFCAPGRRNTSDEFLSHAPQIRPGQAHDANAAPSRRGGDGGDRLPANHPALLSAVDGVLRRSLLDLASDVPLLC